ncbi:hypothetical protein [Halobellus sp. Atlit-38R]|jgi:hypothetical protein|uniref:hypothetical protein n=1 Tax=Halobellus sp. Atlit-38R TaxID=2282131 RepID=UPI0018F4FD3E|nr:hypothetical protein [Halobellus sp. Atlit-38R]
MTETDSFTVVSAMNPHDALTVRSATTHATYQLVEYTDESTRDALAPLRPGESVRLSLSRVGRRGNVWRVDTASHRVHPEAVRTESQAGT